ncbi:mediator of RNA polymerase II transcription subunit 1-like isoform X2 [Stigmatopora nigra]
MNSILLHLHSKYATKNWNDTFQLVRRCMDKRRDDSKPCQAIVGALERLQQVFNGSSMNVTRSRLELAARQHGLGFHFTEATCYLTAELFYLEVTLLPCGSVEGVKVAPHGRDPDSSEFLLQPLRSKNFAEFSTKLQDVVSMYDIPGESESKLKLFAALQHVWKDLRAMSHWPRVGGDAEQTTDNVNDGLLGRLEAEKSDCPLTIHLDSVMSNEENSHKMSVLVTVAPSHAIQKLQVASVVQLPLQLDLEGFPILEPPTQEFPACFVLRLQPPLPLSKSFLHKIHQITVVVRDTDLQWTPLPHLLWRGEDGCSDAVRDFVFPGEAWRAPSGAGMLMEAVPFGTAAHVPRLLEVLRHQAAVNAVLASCAHKTEGEEELAFEVRPETDVSFSVTFQLPKKDSLAILMVSLPDANRITCKLYGLGTDAAILEEYLSGVIKRCPSIPLALRALYGKLSPPADL